MSQYDEITFVAKMLFEKFGAVALDTKQVAEAIGRSEISLKQDRSNGIGIPFSKLGSLVKYSTIEIAKYLVSTQQKTMV